MDVLEVLAELQKPQELAILRLSEPFAVEHDPKNAKRESDVSADARDHTSVANLEAELEHYRDLFTKLRFSYVEQVTKEKFLRAIVSDPPLLVEPNENSELETQLADVKANLKLQKSEVARYTEELERRGKELAQRHDRIRLQTTSIASLPAEIAHLEASINHLKSTLAPSSSNPDLNLPLPATMSLLMQRESELDSLDSQIARLHSSIPRKTAELERIDQELRGLEVQKQGTVSAAKEARRRKEGVGMADELEERGRWAKAQEAALRGMLEVEG
ncbi:MAG: hypothetical protein M1820_003682 [Bogoriella megaspora]|nr:MAG: hypothetical protein M1820_003682 [Bogoriella megaspora]